MGNGLEHFKHPIWLGINGNEFMSGIPKSFSSILKSWYLWVPLLVLFDWNYFSI